MYGVSFELQKHKWKFERMKNAVETRATEQAGLVVRKVDNAIHQINHYSADSVVCFANTYLLESDLSGGQRHPAFEQPGSGVLTFHSFFKYFKLAQVFFNSIETQRTRFFNFFQKTPQRNKKTTCLQQQVDHAR